MKKSLLLASIFCALFNHSFSNEPENETVDSTISLELDSAAIVAQYLDAYARMQDSANNSFSFQTGTIDLGDGIASLKVPAGFKYLDPEQSQTVLVDLWGNPPAETFGLLFPEDIMPLDDNFTFAIELSYAEEGYIEDDDAEDIDYDELLESMQEDISASNPDRMELGYSSMTLVGWASEPYYDSQNKKLHWAKELKFGDEETNTLNYDVRILGRKGYLSMNAISDIEQLELVEATMPSLIPSVNFNDGYAYGDFDPDLDEVAAYGIGGLITGKILAKAGIFAMLLKFWKVIAIAVVGAFGAFRKKIGNFFGGSSREE